MTDTAVSMLSTAEYNGAMHHHHGPVSDDVRATIEHWVSDFLERPSAEVPAAKVGPQAGAVLYQFMEAACHGTTEPADIEGNEVAHSLFDHVAQLSLPATSRDAVPGLVAAFLADLEDVGRLSGGRALASQVRASAPAFRDRAAGKVQQATRAAAKIGRNEPCPCGSGKKYKRCCLNALGS